ncbi:hypothetical protein R3P38DRAFT_3293408 [Favolaschia claudopus]|uniref:Uncharacterized protein n=1 Tax=Favolaschia claudopus TaxID=2862362 RepID=A0AAV9ZHR6_9AGAR
MSAPTSNHNNAKRKGVNDDSNSRKKPKSDGQKTTAVKRPLDENDYPASKKPKKDLEKKPKMSNAPTQDGVISKTAVAHRTDLNPGEYWQRDGNRLFKENASDAPITIQQGKFYEWTDTRATIVCNCNGRFDLEDYKRHECPERGEKRVLLAPAKGVVRLCACFRSSKTGGSGCFLGFDAWYSGEMWYKHKDYCQADKVVMNEVEPVVSTFYNTDEKKTKAARLYQCGGGCGKQFNGRDWRGHSTTKCGKRTVALGEPQEIPRPLEADTTLKKVSINLPLRLVNSSRSGNAILCGGCDTLFCNGASWTDHSVSMCGASTRVQKVTNEDDAATQGFSVEFRRAMDKLLQIEEDSKTPITYYNKANDVFDCGGCGFLFANSLGQWPYGHDRTQCGKATQIVSDTRKTKVAKLRLSLHQLLTRALGPSDYDKNALLSPA